jgi:PAS domain S-box-containing protein
MPAALAALLGAEITGLAVLLAIGLFVYRAFPRRYLLLWNGGWLIYVVYVALSSRPPYAAGVLPAIILLAAQAVITGAIGLAVGQRRPFIPVLGLGLVAAAGEASAPFFFPGEHGWPSAAGYLLLGLLAAGWVVQYGRHRLGWGPSLLGAALLLRLVHLPDQYPEHLAMHLPEAAGSVLAMFSMLVLALESARQHLRWSAAPGLVASVAADCAARGGLARIGLAEDACQRIGAELQRVFEPAYARLHVLGPNGATESEAGFLLEVLPRNAAGESLCTTVLGFERGPEAERWLKQRGLRWAVVVPVPHFGLAEAGPAGVFVLGYRTRRWISPDLMQALAATGRQLGIVLENSGLLEQLSRAYHDWLNTVDAIGDFIVVHDAGCRILRVNRALAARLRREPMDMIQRPCREILPRSQASPWNDCPFCELPQNGDTFDHNLGGYFLTFTSRFGPENASETLHVVKDVTDRKQAEEKYRTIFEKVQEGVFISTRAGRFVDFNEAYARMLGYQRQELLAADIPSLYMARGEREEYLRRIDADGYVSEFEVRLRRKNGEELIGLETSFGTRDESGHAVQFQGFVLDITARKRAEEQLQRHAAMLAAINEISERVSGSLDAEELIRAVARDLGPVFAFDTVSGYLLDRASGTARRVASYGFVTEAGQQELSFPLSTEWLESWDTTRRGVVPLAELPPLPAAALAVQEAEALRSLFAIPLHGPDIGGGIVVSWRQERGLSPAEESLLAAIGRQLNAALENAALYQQTRRAYEELRRTQEQLLQSEKMAAIGQLVSGVAHELNNPLTAIIGYSQLLSTLVSGKPAEYVEKLTVQARRTQRIIQNLLSFSRQSKPLRQSIDLNQVIEETLVLRDYDLRVANIAVERDLAPGLPPVNADLQQLEQVFLNILNNSYDELHQRASGGAIRVRSYTEGRQAVVEFADNGSGLKEPGRVFDPFYTTKPVGKGTGLGLSICYGIIKEHGGEITAANGPGGGAVFRVRLPIASASAAALEL